MNYKSQCLVLILLLLLVSFPCGSAGKESVCNAGDLGSIPGLERSPREGNSYPTSVFWLGEVHGLYSSWGCKKSNTTERLSFSLFSPLLELNRAHAKLLLLCPLSAILYTVACQSPLSLGYSDFYKRVDSIYLIF